MIEKSCLILQRTSFLETYERVTSFLNRGEKIVPDFDVKEKRFEQDIEEYLLTHGGYQKGNPAAFNREKALDTATSSPSFAPASPSSGSGLQKIYGADSDASSSTGFCQGK